MIVEFLGETESLRINQALGEHLAEGLIQDPAPLSGVLRRHLTDAEER